MNGHFIFQYLTIIDELDVPVFPGKVVAIPCQGERKDADNATLLCYWVFLLLVPLIAYFVVVTVYFLRHPKYRGIDFDDVKGRVSVGLIELNEMDILSKAFGKLIGLTLAMVLTALTITANVHPSLKMPGLAWQVSGNNLSSN